MGTLNDKLTGAWKSFTIWFNGFWMVIIPLFDQAKDFLPQIKDYIDQSTFNHVMLFLIVAGNILLRFKTKHDLADK